MSSYWEAYGTTAFRGPCDICHYYGHWSYECNFARQYPTTPYNAQWENTSLYQGYEDNREAYGQNFQECEFHQPSQYQQMENEKSMHDKLDTMIALLKDVEETRQGSRQRQEEHKKWFDMQMSQFNAPVEEIVEDEDLLEYCSRSEDLCLAKQSLVADGQNLKDEAESLYFAKHDPILEPSMPIYTELDYILEFDDSFEDDISEADETELLARECMESDSIQEHMEINAKYGFDDFDGVEMSDNEIKEAADCLQLEEEVSIIEMANNLVKQDLDIPLSDPTCTFSLPELGTRSELHYSWHQDTINPSRKG